MEPNTITPTEALFLRELVTPTLNGIASRVLGKTNGGNITLFAFDKAQTLSEHTAPFDAFVLVLDGTLLLTIGTEPVGAFPGSIVRIPANVPHAVEALEPARMLLIMLRDTAPQA